MHAACDALHLHVARCNPTQAVDQASGPSARPWQRWGESTDRPTRPPIDRNHINSFARRVKCGTYVPVACHAGSFDISILRNHMLQYIITLASYRFPETLMASDRPPPLPLVSFFSTTLLSYLVNLYT